jgi:predicted CoA-binding protein
LGVNSEKAIETILAMNTIAVVGLSSDPRRPSHGVSAYMQSRGYRIIPVNPNESTVLGEKAYARLDDVPVKIDVVNVFRRSDEAGRHVDEAIRLGARAVWLQEDVVDSAAAIRALEAGLYVVMDRCILKEHLRLANA